MTDNFESPVHTSPEMSVAGLPTTLIVASLNKQLQQGPKGYTETDYLSVVMNTVAVLRERHAGDGELLAELDTATRNILFSVVQSINRDWDIDLSQLGLDVSSGSYESDVLEMYRFFIIGRLQTARELLYQIIIQNRKRIVEDNRRIVEKRNQTVAEARRVFASFDDVVVWVSIAKFIEELNSNGGWFTDLRNSLLLLDADNSTLISRIATYWNPEDFAAKYCEPAFTHANLSSTEILLKSWWLEDAPRKSSEASDSVQGTKDENG